MDSSRPSPGGQGQSPGSSSPPTLLPHHPSQPTPAAATVRLEVCVDTIEGLVTALAHGADRIELCSALSVGGLTPSPGLLQLAAGIAAPSRTPVVAMVRPRAGDFVYTVEELEAMKGDIRAAHAAGLSGVVLGASRPDGSLDEEALAGLVAEARACGGARARARAGAKGESPPFTVTLHRAIDLTPDVMGALAVALRVGVDRVLTSGGHPTAFEGKAVIRAMVERAAKAEAAAAAADRRPLCVMAGSGVTAANAAALVAATGVGEVHASCSDKVDPTSDPSVVVKARGFGFLGEGPARDTSGAAVRELAAVVHALTTVKPKPEPGGKAGLK